jgi:hypothetical protein
MLLAAAAAAAPQAAVATPRSISLRSSTTRASGMVFLGAEKVDDLGRRIHADE